MEQKSTRLETIRRLITTEKIGNQEELLQRLMAEGFDLTQATVSRDLKALRAGKRPDPEKGQVFFLPETDSEASPLDSVDNRLLAAGIRSIQFANQFAVIRTLPGYASSIAVHIDRSHRPEIAGTIAGDDTILLIPGESVPRETITDTLRHLFPGLDQARFRR